MSKSGFKSDIIIGWLIAGAVSVGHLFLGYIQAMNKANLLGIVNVGNNAAYVYEGSYFWIFMNAVAVILFYFVYVKYVYSRINNAKKIKPYVMATAVIIMLLSLTLNSLLIINS